MAIIKIYGGPGTGKTRYLHTTVEDLIDHGIKLEHIGFCSYTNSAVNELCERLSVRRKSKQVPWFTTLHGICLSLGVIHDEEFAQKVKNTYRKRGFVEGWKFEFCKQYDIEYEFAEVGASDLLGNRAFTLYTACVGTLFPKYEDIERCIDFLVNNFEQYGWIIQEWHKFKQHYEIIDFEDMLIEGYLLDRCPPIDVFIADEAQDFNRLEFEIVKRIIDIVDKAYLAGDDDQAINTWKGAKAEYFLNLQADEEIVLPKTYRLPPELWKFSQQILKLIERRKEKEIEAVSDRSGSVRFVGIRTIDEITYLASKLSDTYYDKTVFLLFRTNRMVKEAERTLIKLRKPFRRLKGVSLWEKDLILAWNAIAKLRKGEFPSEKEFKFIIEQVQLPESTKKEIKAYFEKTGNIPLFIFELFRKADIEYLVDTSRFDKRQLEILRYADEPIKPESINLWIDTIHAAKGREADIVILCDGITSTIEHTAFNGHRDDELRVWYVGCTRAREKLFVAQLSEFRPFLTEFVSFIDIKGGD